MREKREVGSQWNIQTVGHTCGGYWESIVGILNPSKLLAPRDRIAECQAAESSLEILIGSLTLTVGLGMKT